MKEFFLENWQNILLAMGTYILGIITNYLKQRSTNKAILADNAKLQEETENIKKHHTLDLEKRKYQYESKMEQFFKYFNLLDELTAKSSKEFIKDFPPLIAKFTEDLLVANEDSDLQAKAIAQFTQEINTMTFKANESLLKIKQETNTIKIIANDKIIEILSRMESFYEESLELSKKMMNAIVKMIMMKDDSEVNDAKIKIDKIAEKTISSKNELIAEIKNELDKI